VALARRDGTAVPGGFPSLIDDDFEEFGASGRRWDRAAVLATLTEAPSHVTIEDFAAMPVGEDVMLVTFRTIARPAADAQPRHARRSSLWVRRDGRWRLRFHQGTPTVGDEPLRS
jgi:glyoxylase I family protein